MIASNASSTRRSILSPSFQGRLYAGTTTLQTAGIRALTERFQRFLPVRGAVSARGAVRGGNERATPRCKGPVGVDVERLRQPLDAARACRPEPIAAPDKPRLRAPRRDRHRLRRDPAHARDAERRGEL